MNSPAPWRALTLLALPALVVAMDQNVLFLALPTLTADLGASAVEQLWISDIYGLMVAVFLIPFGALGDRIGRRRLLLAGSAGFAVFSLVAAVAPRVEVLIAARALLGIAGATIAPASLALIVTLFPAPDERARAIGVWMGCFMVGIALGPSLGGLLLDHFWWGAVFLPGVLVMLTVLVGARRALPESEVSADARIDIAGALLLATVMLSLFFGLKSAVLSSDTGGGPAVAGLALSAVALLVFVRRSRRQVRPLVDLSLFAQRRFAAAVGLMTICAALIGGTHFYFAQYLQLAAGLSPLQAGLVMIVPAVAFGLGCGLGPMAARWLTPAQTLAAGLLVAAGGFAVLAAAADGGGVLPTVLGFSLAYLGFGPGAALGTDIIVGTAPSREAGTSSAISETGTELGQALGIAALGSIGTVLYRGHLTPYSGTLDAAQTDAVRQGVMETIQHVPGLAEAAHAAFAHSFSLIAAGSAVITLVLAAISIPLLRPRPSRGPGNQPLGSEGADNGARSCCRHLNVV